MQMRLAFGVAGNPSDNFQEMVDFAARVERLGYQNIWFPDERFYRDVYVSMTACAEKTNSIRLGTAVTDPYFRHPAVTASALASLAELSRGRCALGIGAGYSGFTELNLERRSPANALREAIGLIRGLLGGEEVNFDGTIFHAKKAKLTFSPIHKVPIYVAGRGPQILALGGELGDGTIVGGLASNEGLRYAFEQIRRGTERARRDISDLDIVSWVYCAIADDGDKARELVKPIIMFLVASSEKILPSIGIEKEAGEAILSVMREGHYSYESEELQRLSSKLVSDDLAAKFSIAGTVDDCREKVHQLFQLGVKQIAILPYPESGKERTRVVERFAKEVAKDFLS